MDTQAEQSQQEFQFEGTVFMSVASHHQVSHLPASLNPWRWCAPRRNIEQLKPALHSDDETYTEDRWSITFRLTDVAPFDRDNRSKIKRDYTLTLRAANRTEARNRAKTFLDEFWSATEYTIYETERGEIVN